MPDTNNYDGSRPLEKNEDGLTSMFTDFIRSFSPGPNSVWTIAKSNNGRLARECFEESKYANQLANEWASLGQITHAKTFREIGRHLYNAGMGFYEAAKDPPQELFEQAIVMPGSVFIEEELENDEQRLEILLKLASNIAICARESLNAIERSKGAYNNGDSYWTRYHIRAMSDLFSSNDKYLENYYRILAQIKKPKEFS